eukprot:TRINITY_DN9651_c0_g1_i1.p1 TRINITY_DN9651_c0_g1~~TRINITY_DN9651_c0_g1_i1.p1  ORF type:complete len:193 (-),score=14.18 TRINITY_DN9651_c0_g1_i1:53-631(-)
MFESRPRRILKEYKSISDEEETKKLGYTVSLVDDQMDVWNVKLFGFEGDIANDLKRTTYDHILLEIKFDTDYPSKPPFVRVVYPRFQFRTGHVTVGGSICTELLTNSSGKGGWSSSITMESVILTVRQLMIDGKARIAYTGSYTESEAKAAFVRVAEQHGWVRKGINLKKAIILLVVLLVIFCCYNLYYLLF